MENVLERALGRLLLPDNRKQDRGLTMEQINAAIKAGSLMELREPLFDMPFGELSGEEMGLMARLAQAQFDMKQAEFDACILYNEVSSRLGMSDVSIGDFFDQLPTRDMKAMRAIVACCEQVESAYQAVERIESEISAHRSRRKRKR